MPEMRREEAQRRGAVVKTEPALDRFQLAEDASVSVQHTLWRASCTGCVEDDRPVGPLNGTDWVCGRRGRRQAVEIVPGHARRRVECKERDIKLRKRGRRAVVHHDGAWPSVRKNIFQLAQAETSVDRNRDEAGA